MNIYTAQYRYSGTDRLDITVKGNTYPGSFLAPTWEIVQGIKNGKITQWDYTIKYFAVILDRVAKGGGLALKEIAENKEEITLVCFCPPNTFCHRVLAARLLEELGLGKYLGERLLS